MRLIKSLIQWYEDALKEFDSNPEKHRRINDFQYTVYDIYRDTLIILKSIKEKYEEVYLIDLEKGDHFIYDETYFQVEDIIQVISDPGNKKIIQAVSAAGVKKFFDSDCKVYRLIENTFSNNKVIDHNIENIINSNTVEAINEINVSPEDQNPTDSNEYSASFLKLLKNEFLNFMYKKLVNKFPDGDLKREEMENYIISVTVNKNEFDVLNVTYHHPTKHMNLVQRISMEELCVKTNINYGDHINSSGILDIFG